jgi:hypothetical protein
MPTPCHANRIGHFQRTGSFRHEMWPFWSIYDILGIGKHTQSIHGGYERIHMSPRGVNRLFKFLQNGLEM